LIKIVRSNKLSHDKRLGELADGKEARISQTTGV